MEIILRQVIELTDSILNSLLGFIALVISISVGIGTLRQRANEPNEKRWREIEEWKDEVDDKLGRDYRVLNRVENQMDRRQDFEHIMLASMKGILSHLAEGNHDDQLRKISRDIDDYLLNRHRSESAGDV
jgi:hypothetical protein